MEDHKPKYFDDDGTEINPDLAPKPDLCISCKKDGQPGEEEILCNLTRADQQGEIPRTGHSRFCAETGGN